MSNFCKSCNGKLTIFGDFGALFLRLILAHGFYGPAMKKMNDLESFKNFLIELGVMYPEINAYAALTTEALGVVLLTLGLGTRLIALPLMVVMAVAGGLVHWSNGFSMCSGGFQLTLYFFVMLLTLFGNGAGKFSIDSIICNKWNKSTR